MPSRFQLGLHLACHVTREQSQHCALGKLKTLDDQINLPCLDQ
jgi:hypothetical protein